MITDVIIRRIQVDKYLVKLLCGNVPNELGLMTETQLSAYLTCRPLVDATPQDIVGNLRDGEERTVHFQDSLGG